MHRQTISLFSKGTWGLISLISGSDLIGLQTAGLSETTSDTKGDVLKCNYILQLSVLCFVGFPFKVVACQFYCFLIVAMYCVSPFYCIAGQSNKNNVCHPFFVLSCDASSSDKCLVGLNWTKSLGQSGHAGAKFIKLDTGCITHRHMLKVKVEKWFAL